MRGIDRPVAFNMRQSITPNDIVNVYRSVGRHTILNGYIEEIVLPRNQIQKQMEQRRLDAGNAPQYRGVVTTDSQYGNKHKGNQIDRSIDDRNGTMRKHEHTRYDTTTEQMRPSHIFGEDAHGIFSRDPSAYDTT